MRFNNNIKQKVKKLKQEVLTISLALTDERTPGIAKLMIFLTISYALSPIDLIPDFIPVLGLADDLIILPIMFIITLRLIPDHVLNDCREKVNNDMILNKKSGLYAAFLIICIWIFLAVFITSKIIK